MIRLIHVFFFWPFPDFVNSLCWSTCNNKNKVCLVKKKKHPGKAPFWLARHWLLALASGGNGYWWWTTSAIHQVALWHRQLCKLRTTLEPFNLQLNGGEVVVTQSSGVDYPEATVTRWRYEQRNSRVLWIPAEPFHTIWGSERISRTITQQDKEPTPGRDAWALSADTRSSSLLDSYSFSFRYDDEDDEDVQKSLETRPLTLYDFVLCAHRAKISPKEATKEYRNLNS